jgi:predicted transcriptional regulator
MIGSGLSRREREILEILHRLGSASANEIQDGLSDPPSYSAVRSILRILEAKGHVQHREEGKRYLYAPTEARQTAARTALNQVVQTFFGGSLEEAVKTFLSDQEAQISQEELERLAAMITQARNAEEASQ